MKKCNSTKYEDCKQIGTKYCMQECNISKIESEVRCYLDQIFLESLTLPENFGKEILKEITDRFIEDGYPITKQTVIEEMLWCYISKMQ